MNRTIEEWAKVDAKAVASGSQAQAENVLKMALQDIARLSTLLETAKQDRDRTARNRDMWKGQCERQAEQLRKVAR
jgi:hypothetical protein